MSMFFAGKGFYVIPGYGTANVPFLFLVRQIFRFEDKSEAVLMVSLGFYAVPYIMKYCGTFKVHSVLFLEIMKVLELINKFNTQLADLLRVLGVCLKAACQIFGSSQV